MNFSLKQRIDEIGRDMALCTRKCGGIRRDPEDGVPPRGLFFDKQKAGNGCVVVGINPGKADEKERSVLREAACKYEGFQKYILDRYRSEPYHQKIQSLLRDIGITGSVLWTEVVKCQCDELSTRSDRETIRTCTEEYLKTELAIIPVDWPIFAIGRVPFNWLSRICSDRSVIGLPHTNAYGNLFGTVAKHRGLRERVYEAIQSRSAVWLRKHLEIVVGR